MNSADTISRLEVANPSLTRAGPSLWRLQTDSNVSFPAELHEALTAIESRSYWFAHRNDVILAVVRKFPPTGCMVDIGGGNGFVSLRLMQDGFDPLVIEPGQDGAQAAAGRGLSVIQAPFQDLTVESSSLPSAGMFDVLEHIEDDQGAVGNLFRALTPGGRLYIAVPAYGFLWSSDDIVAGHFRRYRLGQLQALLVRAGFEIEFGTYFFSALVPVAFLLRSVPSLLRLRARNEMTNTDTGHTLPGGLIGNTLRRSFVREVDAVSRGVPIRTGTSCIVAARKPRG